MKDKYILVTWYNDTGDYGTSFETEFEFVTDKQLEDINQLMRDYHIKRWVKNPETVTKDTYKLGDASLIEFRNIEVKPIKVVETWGYAREHING